MSNERVASKELGQTLVPARNHERSLDALLISGMPQLHHAAARLLPNPEDAEDALQDGLLSAFRHFQQFQGRSSLSTWLYSIVTNAARMQLRSRARLHAIRITEGLTDEGDGYPAEFILDLRLNPEEECANEERARIFRTRVRSLPRNYRVAVEMCVIEGLAQREVAEQLGVPTGTVKTRLRRAVALLKGR